MTMTAPDLEAPTLPYMELTEMAANLRDRNQRDMIIAGALFHRSMYNLVLHCASQNAANGNNAERRQATRKDSVVLQRFHVKREHAIRTNVNDKERKGYNSKKNREHPYYGKRPFPKMENKFEHSMEDGKRKYKKAFNPKTGKEEKVVKDGYVDEESIQPLISAKMDENRDQIIRDMIDEKDVYTSKDLSEVGQQQGKNIPYWRLRSAKAKNDYIQTLRAEHPDWTWLEEIPLYETETEEY